MKHVLMTLSFFGLNLWVNAQSASVEKSIFGIQAGIGFWVYNEVRLSKKVALRSELGLDAEYLGIGYDNDVLLGPAIRLEPRWYYNLNNRENKSKRTDGNSGNFFSLNTSFNPAWFTISPYDNVFIRSHISFVPTWGIRRNIGKHFDFETGIGIGYEYIFPHQPSYPDGFGEPTANLRLRFGYRF